MLKKVIAILLLGALLLTALPAFAASSLKCATVNLNVRSGPGTKYEIIGYLTKGEAVTVTGKSGNWAKLSYNGGTAYAYNKYLKTADSDSAVCEDTSDTSTATLYVIKSREKMAVNGYTAVYVNPHRYSSVLQWVDEGDTLIVTGTYNNTWKSVDVDGTVGYVMSKYLTKIYYQKSGCTDACSSVGCALGCKCADCLAAAAQSFYSRNGFLQVSRSNVKVYPGASTSYAPIETLSTANTYKYTGYNSTWVRLDLGDDDVGYALREYVNLITK